MRYIDHKFVHGGYGLQIEIEVQAGINKVIYCTSEGCSHHPNWYDIERCHHLGFDGKLDIKSKAIPSS